MGKLNLKLFDKTQVFKTLFESDAMPARLRSKFWQRMLGISEGNEKE